VKPFVYLTAVVAISILSISSIPTNAQNVRLATESEFDVNPDSSGLDYYISVPKEEAGTHYNISQGSNVSHCDSLQRATMYGHKVSKSTPCLQFGANKLFNRYIDYCNAEAKGQPGCRPENFTN
jgi:hypothetical protein